MGRTNEADGFQAWVNLLQANAVVAGALEDRLQRESNLSLAEHEALARIAESPEGFLRMADLSGLLLVSKSGGTRLIDRLAGAGLVTRESCPTDRRVIYAVITDAGRDALDRSAPVVQSALDATFSRHLTDTDVRRLRGMLRKVLEGNGKREDTRCAPSLSAKEPQTSGAASSSTTGSG